MTAQLATPERRRRPKYRRIGGRIVAEHIVVWQRHHGPVPAGMHIHHINGDNHDNRIENLQIVTPTEHRHIHAGYEIRDGVMHKPCTTCGELKPLTEFYRYCYYPHDGVIPACKPCHREACRQRQREFRDRRRAEFQTN